MSVNRIRCAIKFNQLYSNGAGDEMKTDELFYFIKERESIRKKKEAGFPKPWTTDPILRQYRFCNVRREDDAVTKWIAENWRDHKDWRNHEDLWFAMVIARFVNWPNTLEKMEGAPLPWVAEKFVEILDIRASTGSKTWSSAYIINAVGAEPGESKASLLARKVFTPLWAARADVRPCPGELLQDFYYRLSKFRGMGSFMAGQVVADVKYTPAMRQAKDWDTFAVSGPGSRRGLNIVVGREVSAPWREAEWKIRLLELRGKVNEFISLNGLGEVLHAQDTQSTLCELSKMVRGYSRQKYPGSLQVCIT